MPIKKNHSITSVIIAATLALAMVPSCSQPVGDDSGPANYIYFGRDRERIHENNFLDAKSIIGAQLTYAWRELERQRDQYDFEEMQNDLAFLNQHGKRMFVQIQDVSFDETIVNVPKYVVNDPAMGGGIARQWEFESHDESSGKNEGWVARRWDPAVRARFILLLQALAKEFDGKLEGVNFPETAVEFGWTGKLYPPGFTPHEYLEGVKATMSAAKKAFHKTVIIQYANFMPGGREYLKAVYAYAESVGVGIGGPDLLPHRGGQQTHSYPLIVARRPNVVAGIAVQWGNLADKDPETGKQVTVEELARFAEHDLRPKLCVLGDTGTVLFKRHHPLSPKSFRGYEMR